MVCRCAVRASGAAGAAAARAAAGRGAGAGAGARGLLRRRAAVTVRCTPASGAEAAVEGGKGAASSSSGAVGGGESESGSEEGVGASGAGSGGQQAGAGVGAAPFCIIEDGSIINNFDSLSGDELNTNIESRRNEIFRLMEEVRRLRVQQKIRQTQENGSDESDLLSFASAIPLFPDLTGADKLDDYYKIFGALIIALIFFGGIVAPTLEVYLGVGGTSYEEVIQQLHLPSQLAQVDPIVASFTGGAVGVLSALLLVEKYNVDQVKSERCVYCSGTGYLPCGACGGTGYTVDANGVKSRCSQCGSSGKVMCPSCLCTGMALATEHDPRIDPFTLEADPRGGEELTPFMTGTQAKVTSK